MFSHVMIGSDDIARSKKFYDALSSAIGGGPGVEDARGRLIYTHNGGRFLVTKPINEAPPTHATRPDRGAQALRGIRRQPVHCRPKPGKAGGYSAGA